MRVAIDAHSLADTSAFRGIGTYVRELINGLASSADVCVLALAEASVSLPAGIERVRIRRARLNRLSGLEHHVRLPVDLLRVRCDVMHSLGARPAPAVPGADHRDAARRHS